MFREPLFPAWAIWSVYALAALFGGIVLWRLSRREWVVTLSEQREMQTIASSIVTVSTGSLVATHTLSWEAALAVAFGLVWYVPIVVAQTSIGQRWSAALFPNTYDRCAAGWVAIATVSWIGYGLLGMKSRVSLAYGVVIVLSTGLVVYDLQVKHDLLDVGDLDQSSDGVS